MDQATLFDHCIIYTDGILCNKPSSNFNGLCFDHQRHTYKCTSTIHQVNTGLTQNKYYNDVFKPYFTAQVDVLVKSSFQIPYKDRIPIVRAMLGLLSKHRHFFNVFVGFKNIVKTKMIEFSEGCNSLTRTENDAFVQDMKTYYHSMFPYDDHEFNL